MEYWILYSIVAIIAIIIEILAPTLFCINFAIAGVITAFIALFYDNFYILLSIFIVLSLLSIIFIKPILQKMINKEQKPDSDSKYINKIVKSIEPITQNSGAVTIYDERWEARLNEGCEEIPSGCDVKIVKIDNLTLYVEKI